jgi:uncharacterized NAD-dependent epimerase/dehydratase family protein
MRRLSESQAEAKIYSGIDKTTVLVNDAKAARAREAAEEEKMKPKKVFGKPKQPAVTQSSSGKPRNLAARTMHASAPELFALCHGAQRGVQQWFPES